MADSKLTALTAVTTASTDDILYIVDAPGSTPVSKKITFDNLQKSITAVSSLTGIIKATSGTLSSATQGTDYAPATSGTAILKGNGSGGFSNATAGTDYIIPSAFVDNELVGTGDDTTTVFTLDNTPISNSEHIYVGGVRQTLTTNYSMSGATITFVSAPPTGQSIIADYRK